MPQMMVTGSVVVGRGEERIEPPIGQAFDFTQGEIDTLLRDSPPPIRAPRDESEGISEVGKPGAPVRAGKVGPEMTSAGPKVAGNPLAGNQKTKGGAKEDDGEL